MKKLLFLFFIFFISCQNNSDPDNTSSVQQIDTAANTPVISDSAIVSKNSIPLKNQKDKDGKKQGMWDYYEKGILKGFETYKNDTLTGPFKYWINYKDQIYEGNNLNGKQNGIIKSYRHYSKQELLGVSYYKNGLHIWSGYPFIIEGMYSPVKPFYIESDSVYIECPYGNDLMWYEGLVINKEAVGIHKMYYPNGKLKFEVDYNLKTIKEFDSIGTLLSRKKQESFHKWKPR